jgi:hypothetical protein
MSDEPLTSKDGHEPNRIDARGVFWALGGVAAGVVLVAILMGALDGMFFAAARRQPAAYPSLAPLPTLVAAPRLDADQPRELEELHKSETNVLETFGWINRQKGVARIPISSAIDFVVEHGLPRGKPSVPEAGKPTRKPATRAKGSPALPGRGDQK